MNEKIEAEKESVEEKWYEDVLNWAGGAISSLVLDNFNFLFDIVGTGMNIFTDGPDYTSVGDKAIENMDQWIADNLVTEKEAYYKGKAAGNLAGVIEFGAFLFSAAQKIGKGISSFGGAAALADGPLIIGDSVLATGLVVTGVATAGSAGLAMLAERARNKQSENLAKVDGARGEKLREKADSVTGKTKKYVPDTGNWTPTGNTKSGWLKENEYSTKWRNPSRDQLRNRQGKPVSMDLVDKNGNSIGRVDKNYRVNGKVVPEHAHLDSDIENVHYWFDD